MGMVGVPMRQETARAAIAERLARSKHLLGALLVGSLAAGVADAASDIDLLVLRTAWEVRAGMARQA